jgi:hypothetical protein
MEKYAYPVIIQIILITQITLVKAAPKIMFMIYLLKSVNLALEAYLILMVQNVVNVLKILSGMQILTIAKNAKAIN